MTPNKKGHPVKSGPRVLPEPALRGNVLVRRNTGQGYSPLQCYSITPLLFPFRRPQGGLAVAVIRAHPGQNFPLLTSRGRPRQQKPTALIEHANAPRGLAHLMGSSMKIAHLPLNRSLVQPIWFPKGECKAFGLSLGECL